MAIETFTWTPDDEADVEGTLRTRTSQFGDGYAQVSGDGINGETQSWSLTFGGLPDEVGPILAFLRRHQGYRSFLWTPPGGELGLYRCTGYRKQRRPGAIEVLSATFDQAFHP